MPATGWTGTCALRSKCQQLEKEEHARRVIHPAAVSNWRDHIACVCVRGQRTSDWRDLSVFLVFLSELNLIYMGIYVELASMFQVDLTGE